ncbi:FUN14 domain-containing protein 1A isoform X2 [Sitodiplosis mosellana]|uniref:FUN14 domain-containing protein 1A isoform X2 n=1 Tax=Sitodiplosis mosellana TaxID=263140 RepID=UPI002444FD19|nr:FUN14 domain-containing protein 1A isoform X2 [Sitodiplosis mosellana]
MTSSHKQKHRIFSFIFCHFEIVKVKRFLNSFHCFFSYCEYNTNYDCPTNRLFHIKRKRMVILRNDKDNKLKKMPASTTGSSCLDKILADVSKQSATKQILIGAASGWVTGFASAKVGRLAAFTIGGAIILLEVANEQGIIKIDWSRLYRKVDEAGDKVQETLTGEAPKWMDKAEYYIKNNVPTATGFLGGFLLGISS